MRFKTRAEWFSVNFERFCALRFFAKFYKYRKYARPCFEPARTASVVLTQNRILRKIEVAVRACRRKRSFKRESVRYLCCGGNGNLMWADKNFEIYPKYLRVQKAGIFILSQGFSFSQK